MVQLLNKANEQLYAATKRMRVVEHTSEEGGVDAAQSISPASSNHLGDTQKGQKYGRVCIAEDYSASQACNSVSQQRTGAQAQESTDGTAVRTAKKMLIEEVHASGAASGFLSFFRVQL